MVLPHSVLPATPDDSLSAEIRSARRVRIVGYQEPNNRIIGDVTLEQVAEFYEWAAIREMAIFPWYEDGKLVALVTGWTQWGGFGFVGERVGFLEHFIIKPAARRKLELMNLFPSYIADVCRAKGVHRLVLCIHHDHPKRDRLEKWALRRGYLKYGINDFADWYSISLKESPDGQVHPRTEDPGGNPDADADRP